MDEDSYESGKLAGRKELLAEIRAHMRTRTTAQLTVEEIDYFWPHDRYEPGRGLIQND